MLKKYLYTGILIGNIVLTGCSGNEKTEERVKEEITEDLSEGQAVEVESLPVPDKGEVVSEVPLELTQEQKEDYYKQYVEIVEKVIAEYPGTTMEVVPFDEFAEQDWVEPEKFRQLAIDRANIKFNVEKQVIYEN